MKLRIFLLTAAILMAACSKPITQTSTEPVKPAYTLMSVVHFSSNSATLSTTATTILKQAAKSLNNDSSVQIEVAGHADSRNTEAHNIKLSNRRALKVQKYLVKKGVKAERLTIKAYGESQPIASNNSKAGMGKNRRVELRAK